jgi:hypothetical protein
LVSADAEAKVMATFVLFIPKGVWVEYRYSSTHPMATRKEPIVV